MEMFLCPGSRLQPWVQFQRRALSLPPNATYTNLTAFLTVTHSGQNTQHFPYLQGLGSNSTGNTPTHTRPSVYCKTQQAYSFS